MGREPEMLLPEETLQDRSYQDLILDVLRANSNGVVRCFPPDDANWPVISYTLTKDPPTGILEIIVWGGEVKTTHSHVHIQITKILQVMSATLGPMLWDSRLLIYYQRAQYIFTIPEKILDAATTRV